MTANYVITTEAGTLTITKRPVTLTSATDTKEYDGNPLTNNTVTVGGQGFATGEGATYNVTGTQTIVGTSDNTFTYTLNQGTLAGNYDITTVEGTLTVTNRPTPFEIEIVSNSATYTYDGTEKSVSGFVTTTFTVNGNNFTVEGLSASVAQTNAGTYPNTITGTEIVKDINGNDVTAQFTVTKTPGNLVINPTDEITLECPTATAATKVYDGTALEPEATAIGVVATDEFVIEYSIDGGNTWSETVPSIIAKGTQAVKVRASNPNYVTETCEYTLEVTCRPLTVTANTEAFTYDGNVHTNNGFTTNTGEGVGLVGEDEIEVVITGSIQFPSQSPVTNVVGDITFENGSASNYCITKVNGQLTMTYDPQEITITADSETWTYDGQEHTKDSYKVTIGENTYNVGADGIYTFENGDVLTVNVTGAITEVGTEDNEATIVSIMHGNENVAAAYNPTVNNGTLTITKAPAPEIVCPTGTSITKMYDGQALAPAASATGIGNDTFTIQYSIDNGQNWSTNVPSITHFGTQSVKVQALNDNYETATCEYTLSITKRSVTLTSATDEKVYDGQPLTNSTVTVSGDGFVNGEGATYDVTGTQTAVGYSNNTFTYTLNNNTSADDYTITKVEGVLTVTANVTPIVITSGNNTWMYDGNNHTEETYTVTYGGTALTADATGKVFTLPTGDKVTISNPASVKNVSETADNNNTYDYVIDNESFYSDVTANYGKLTITPRTVLMTSATAEKVYDATPLTRNAQTDVTVTGDGFVTGEGATYDITGTQTNVGSSDNEFTYTLNQGTLAENYTISTAFGTLKVTPMAVTITAKDSTKVYDATPLTQPGFTATALAATDNHTFNVVMTTASTITNVGTQPNVIATVDGVAVTTGTATAVGNYMVTTEDGELEVTPHDLTITIGNDTKVYDGTPLVTNYDNATVTVEGLQGGATLTAGEVTTSSPNAGTYTYTGTTAPTAADGMTITTPFQTSDDISNYNVTYNFTQTITRKDAEIDITATKIYDGTPLVVNYNDATVTVTGLVAGDALNAGKATTAVGTTPSYKVGQYTYTYTPSGMALSFAPVNGTVLLDPEFNTINGIENYNVTYNLELDITLRTLEITAADAEKVYDGEPLTSDVYTIAAVDGLAEGDEIATIVQEGSQLCVGSTEHTISDAVIVKDGEENVTDQYTIIYHNGTLTVTNFTDFTCPAAENITLNYGECETEYTIQGEPTVGTGMAAGSYTVTNDLADQNPLPVGTHTITWMLIDDCGNTMATCTQTVTVEYPECPNATDADGNEYVGVRIGCECWTQTNLRSEHYQITGSPAIPDVMTYKASPYYDNETANLNNYGHLYTWNAAINGGDTNSYG